MSVKTGIGGGARRLDIQPGARIDPKSKAAPRTMRCKTCGGQAIEQSDGKGGSVLRCPNCRSEYNFTRL